MPGAVLPPRAPDLAFEVYSEPIPQGSLKPVRRGTKLGVVSDNPRTAGWRERVAYTALAAQGAGWTPFDGPVVLAVEFYMPRPKGHPKTIRTVPMTKPDVDKLARAVGDALTAAGTYEDDSRIIDLVARARYAAPDPRLALPWEPTVASARIGVWHVTAEDTWDDQPLIPLPEPTGLFDFEALA